MLYKGPEKKSKYNLTDRVLFSYIGSKHESINNITICSTKHSKIKRLLFVFTCRSKGWFSLMHYRYYDLCYDDSKRWGSFLPRILSHWFQIVVFTVYCIKPLKRRHLCYILSSCTLATTSSQCLGRNPVQTAYVVMVDLGRMFYIFI